MSKDRGTLQLAGMFSASSQGDMFKVERFVLLAKHAEDKTSWGEEPLEGQGIHRGS